jgi:hypothetical protein
MNNDEWRNFLKELLGTAAIEGAVETVEKLLAEDGLGADVRSGYHYPFWRAAQYGHTPIVRLLHERYEVPVDSFGGMAIRLAVKCGHAETVDYLIERGADVKGRTHELAYEAFSQGRADIFRKLIAAGATLQAPIMRTPADYPWSVYSPEIEQVLTEFNLWAPEPKRNVLARIFGP